MSDGDFPQNLTPRPEDVTYDLDQALSSVVFLRTHVPEDALTASVLGTERSGHGVVIRDSGLILTIGYLVAEAETVWVVDSNGGAVPGHVVGYDQETGFGLVQALQRLQAPVIPIGSSEMLSVGESVVVGGYGGRKTSVKSRVVGKQEFAGYWEYLLDEAIFTTPAHPNWGGTAVIGADGTLRGIGSLLVQTNVDGDSSESNMIVPIDLLKPILEDILIYGRANRPANPWLGMMTTEIKGNLIVINLVDGGPAEQAGIHTGDVVLAVDAEPVEDLPLFFRQIRQLGSAGVEVPLTLLRNGETLDIAIPSASRDDYLKKPHLH